MTARWDDDNTALSAAFEGSKVCSTIDLSWVVCKCVGDVFGTLPCSIIFLVEYCLFKPPPDWPPAVDGVGAGGDIVAS